MENDIKLMLEKIKDWIGRPVVHFKGDTYIIESVSKDCNNPNRYLVNYRAIYGDCELWSREITDFFSEVTEEQKNAYNWKYDFKFQPAIFESKRKDL